MTREQGTVIPILPAKQRAGRPGGRKGGFTSGYSGALGNLLQDLLLHSGLAVYVFDVRDNRLYINDIYRDIYNQIVTEPIITEAAAAESQSLPLPQALEHVIDEITGSGKRVIRAERVDYAAGVKHFRAHHFPIYHGEEILAVGGIYYDVTRQTRALSEAKTSQTRFDDVIRSTSDWVWETDAEGKLTFISDRITEALGCPPATLLGRGLLEVGRFVDAAGRQIGSDRSLERAQPFRNKLFEIRDRDGKARRIHLSGVPVFSAESGRLSGFRGTGADITARHVAEETARQSRRDLEGALEDLKNKNLQLESALDKVLTATRAKGEFLATMSHELRTPLNAIIGFAEVMLLNTFGDLPPKYETYVKEIIDAGRHLLSKINDILDVAKAESNDLALTSTPTSLREVIDRALAHVALRAEEKRIDISGVRVDDDWTIMADPERATQVFINLLSNAIKFTTERGSVGLDVAPGEGGMLKVTVWDTGIGIPPDKQEMIFETFQQIHDGIFSRSQEGTGVGLTVAHHMAVLMGGDITLESQPGRGSRFTVTLPLAERDRGADI